MGEHAYETRIRLVGTRELTGQQRRRTYNSASHRRRLGGSVGDLPAPLDRVLVLAEHGPISLRWRRRPLRNVTSC